MNGLQKYTEQEFGNISLGQAGCIFVDTNTAAVAPEGLIAEDSSKWANTEAAASAGGSGGLQIDHGNTFPKGITIYGRWTEIDLNSAGTVIAYIG